MNIASRMESDSEENRINMSSDAHAALIQQWPSARTTPRGETEIKVCTKPASGCIQPADVSSMQSSVTSAAAQGKGLMKRYFLDQDEEAVAVLLGNDGRYETG